MAAIQQKDRRGEPRFPLMGDLSDHIYLDGLPLRCLAVDVARTSLRILAFKDQKPYTKLFLKLDDDEVPLLVIWCELESAQKGQYAIGLKALGREHDLVRLFGNRGWLSQFLVANQ